MVPVVETRAWSNVWDVVGADCLIAARHSELTLQISTRFGPHLLLVLICVFLQHLLPVLCVFLQRIKCKVFLLLYGLVVHISPCYIVLMPTSHIKASLTKLLLLSFARKWSRRTKWSCKVISKKCIAGHITPIKLAHSGYLITSVPFTRFQQDWAAHYIHLSVHSFTKCAMNVNTKYGRD